MFLGVLATVSAFGLGGRRASAQELFSSDSVFRFSLRADLEALRNDRSQESHDRAAHLRMATPAGDSLEIPLEVRTRGRYRLQKDICSFPPLRLDFQEDLALGSVFDGQDKVKLVTYCHDRDSYEQNVLEEYLAYRIYNRITDASFRVRLAEITYIDTKGRDDPVTRMGFLIEDEDAMAARINGMVLDVPGARATDFQPAQMGEMFLFQYLIGNIDWSTANSQNLKILRVGMDYLAIPYDFDWSGLVDAPYVGPSPLTERLHESVRERLYLGTCWDEVDFPAVFARFEERREGIYDVARSVPGLTEANTRFAIAYLDEFYDFISDPKQAETALGKMCRSG
jgi:hypothetical protein